MALLTLVVGCLLLLTLSNVRTAPVSEASLAAYNNLNKKLYNNYKDELPSCDEKFYTVTQADRATSQACKNADIPLEEGCSAECNAYIEIYGTECEREEVLLEAKIFPAILAKVEAGTELEKEEVEVIEAAFTRVAVDGGAEAPEDGFLSTAAKQQAFFAKADNLATLKEAATEATDEVPVVQDYITKCLDGASNPSGSGLISGFAMNFAIAGLLWYAYA